MVCSKTCCDNYTQKHTCYDEIEPCAQNTLVDMGLILNVVEKAYVIV